MALGLSCQKTYIRRTRRLFSCNRDRLLKLIHRPWCEPFHVGTIFFLTGLQTWTVSLHRGKCSSIFITDISNSATHTRIINVFVLGWTVSLKSFCQMFNIVLYIINILAGAPHGFLCFSQRTCKVRRILFSSSSSFISSLISLLQHETNIESER